MTFRPPSPGTLAKSLRPLPAAGQGRGSHAARPGRGADHNPALDPEDHSSRILALRSETPTETSTRRAEKAPRVAGAPILFTIRPATRLPTGVPPRKARPKMLTTRPRKASGAFSWTRELSVEKAPTRQNPETKSSAIESSGRREVTASTVATP